MKLKDKVAIVTGSGTGIGKAIAIAFAKEGAKVVLAARNLANLQTVVDEIKAAGGIGVAMKTDISEEQQIQKLVSDAVSMFKQIDVLVNNSAADGVHDLTIAEMDIEMWNRVMKINLTGTMICCREALKAMIPRKSGSIINISSVAGLYGLAKRSPYAVSKWGINGLTETLAIEVGQYNIRANCISPAATNTERFQGIAKSRGVSPQEMAGKFLIQHSLGRMVEPSEIASTAVFLASDDSSAITGQNIAVTCGYHILGPTEIK